MTRGLVFAASMYWVTAVVCSAAQLPAGTELHIRLNTPIVASTAKSGQAVAAVLVTPVLDSTGRILVPSGSQLTGKLEDPKIAQKDVPAQFRPDFTELDLPGAAATKINAQLTDVDNARETVDEHGNVIGILASETLSSRIDTGIGKIAERYPGLADILGGIKGGMIAEANPDIHFEPGVEMTLRLTQPVTITAAPTGAKVPSAIQPVDELVRLVQSQPFRTIAEKPPKPSDVTNLMFIGTAEEIQAAFRAAGWTTAEALNSQSTFETIRAVIEMRGYAAIRRLPSRCLRSMANRPIWFSRSKTIRSRNVITSASGGVRPHSTIARCGSLPPRTTSASTSPRKTTRSFTGSTRRSTRNAPR